MQAIDESAASHKPPDQVIPFKFGPPIEVGATGAAITRLDAARRALSECTSFDDLQAWEDKAAAVREYGRRIGDREIERDSWEIRQRAHRRRGELLCDLHKGGQIARSRKKPVDDERPVYRLRDLGVTKDQSSRDQRVATLSADEFERRVREGRKGNKVPPDISDALAVELDRAGRTAAFAERTLHGGTVEGLQGLVAAGHRFSAILADPPWHFVARSQKGEGRSASQHYETDRSEAENIKTLPVRELAADDCVLFLWMVDWCPRLALEVIEAWGFEHKTSAFTWAKQNATGVGWHMGQGYWTRANPEDCWLATRGHPKRLNADVRQLIIAPVMEHSRKPDEVHDRIERLVEGPYLELYARHKRAGWTCWGNEIEPPGESLDIPEFLRRPLAAEATS